MEHIGISKEKEEFVPRKSKEEFFRDGKVIEQLFEITEDWMSYKYDINRSANALLVFNHAYSICWMFIEGKGSVPHIANSVEFENDSVRNYAWAVAYALFQLHDKFYPLTKRTQMEITLLLPRDFYATRYEQFVKDKVLENPVDFRAPECMPEPETDMVQARDYVMAAFDKAIAMEEENKRLREQLEVEKKLRKATGQIIMELQEKLKDWENDSFYKAVNIKTILEYAQNPENCGENDVKIIKLMLLDLCASKVPADVIKKIKTLKCGKIISIENVTQMNTAATEITNHYHH